MSSKQVIGSPIPRRKNVNILEDMADIAEAVKGTGLPEEFFSECCRVHDQIYALCNYMNLSPVQVTILSVAVELTGEELNLLKMADYIGCPKARLHSFYWDFFFLKIINYLDTYEIDGRRQFLEVHDGLIASWCKNRLYSAFGPQQSQQESSALASRVTFKIHQYKDGVTSSRTELKQYLDALITCYHPSELIAYIHCLSVDCPYPALGLRVLLLVSVFDIEYASVNGMTRVELSVFTCDGSVGSSQHDLDEVLAYFTGNHILEPDGDTSIRMNRHELGTISEIIGFPLPDEEDMIDYEALIAGDNSKRFHKQYPLC